MIDIAAAYCNLIVSDGATDTGTISISIFGDWSMYCHSCKMFDCFHIDTVIKNEEDAGPLFKMMNEAERFNVTVPLFPTVIFGKNACYSYPATILSHRSISGRVYGYIQIRVLNDPAAGPYGNVPDLVRLAGVTMAKIGVLVEGQGVQAIKTAIAAWVSSQIAIANGKLECESFYHSTSARGGSLRNQLTGGQWDTIIVLEGTCADCKYALARIAKDVPDL